MALEDMAAFNVAFWFLLGVLTVVTATNLFHLDFTERHLTALVSMVAALYLHHYFSNFAKLPAVFCKKGTRLEKLLVDHIPTLTRPYRPPIWCAESRVQTIIRCLAPCPSKVNWKIEVVESTEGGRFCVGWYHNDESTKFPNPATRPTIVVIPGVTSTIHSSYVKSIANSLADCGFRIILLIYRGLEGMELLTPKTYCATYTADLNQSTEMIQERFPKSRTFAIGVSLGTLVLGRYLSEKGERARFHAGMLICCPFYPPDCAKQMDSLANRLLINRHVTRALRQNYRRNSHLFQSIVDHERVEESMSIRDFDDHFTSPVFGYQNVDEYYADAALSAERMQNIKIPLLCVGSNDDPFSPEWALPKEDIAQSENVALVMTYGGGHVSHLQMFFPFTKSYYEHVMEEYLDAVIK